jgi:hypothetical protein
MKSPHYPVVKSTVVMIFAALFAASCGLLGLGPTVQLGYFYFLEREAAPKFSALNQAVFDELPPPDGIVELERRITGTNINSTHGRYLSVDYLMGQMTEEQVSSYYTDLLLSKGWQSYAPHKQSDYYFSYYFYRGTACLGLTIYPQGTPAPQYGIDIWHDFWSQSFSPPKPNLVLLGILDFGVTNFSECTSSVYH